LPGVPTVTVNQAALLAAVQNAAEGVIVVGYE
jgi:hypothetical protein